MRPVRADGAAAGRVLQEELGPLGVVDEAVGVARLGLALLEPRVAAPLVGDAGAPDLAAGRAGAQGATAPAGASVSGSTPSIASAEAAACFASAPGSQQVRAGRSRRRATMRSGASGATAPKRRPVRAVDADEAPAAAHRRILGSSGRGPARAPRAPTTGASPGTACLTAAIAPPSSTPAVEVARQEAAEEPGAEGVAGADRLGRRGTGERSPRTCRRRRRRPSLGGARPRPRPRRETTTRSIPSSSRRRAATSAGAPSTPSTAAASSAEQTSVSSEGATSSSRRAPRRPAAPAACAGSGRTRSRQPAARAAWSASAAARAHASESAGGDPGHVEGARAGEQRRPVEARPGSRSAKAEADAVVERPARPAAARRPRRSRGPSRPSSARSTPETSTRTSARARGRSRRAGCAAAARPRPTSSPSRASPTRRSARRRPARPPASAPARAAGGRAATGGASPPRR